MLTQRKLAFIQEHAPCYLYEKGVIENRCTTLREALPQVGFLYSIKTNPFPPVVKTVAGQGFGADAASAREVLLSRESGMAVEQIFYSAPGKTRRDLERAWGECTFIADSSHELDLLEELARERGETAQVGVRVAPSFAMGGGKPGPSKFGIPEEELAGHLAGHPHLRVTGIHVHLRSQVLDSQLLCRYYRDCYALAQRIQALPGVELRFLNFGSGIGAVYDTAQDRPVDLAAVGETFRELQRQNEAELGLTFYVETGRYVVCNAGTYYTPIVDKKRSGGKTYLIVQNGLNGFLRPAIANLLRQNLGHYPAAGQEPLYTSPGQAPLSILGRSGETERVSVVGNLCTALDVVEEEVELPHAEIGDILAVANAGSYAYTLSPQLFSSQEPPRELLWEA